MCLKYCHAQKSVGMVLGVGEKQYVPFVENTICVVECIYIMEKARVVKMLIM